MEKRYYYIAAIIAVIGICAICYHVGYGSATRDVNIQRVQSTQQQLDNAREQLKEADRTNRSARELVTNSVTTNDRIKQSIARSEDANRRTSTAVNEAKSIVTDAKRTAEQDERIIADSKSILERAIERARQTEKNGTAE